jgi:carboxypeptidase Taq
LSVTRKQNAGARLKSGTGETLEKPLERLKAILAEIADIKHAESILDWDSRVSMPPRGAQARAGTAATLARLSHERLIADDVGEVLDELAPLVQEAGEDSTEAALVRVTRRLWDRSRRVPTELAGELAEASGVAVAAWDEAKARSDFASFKHHLERQVELKRRYIDCFPETETAYDVLLEDYEEGMTTAEVVRVFDRLKEVLVPLVEEWRGRPLDDEPLRGPFSEQTQRQLGLEIVHAFGYDDSSWRIDETPHPFASKPGLGDIRLTTHTTEGDLTSLFSTMHEFGHGVYEFDIDPSFARTPLAGGTSSAIHESQSRTWENLVGRSVGFWRWFYPTLQAGFPAQLAAIDENRFISAVNAVRPGLIRGDADEVTYGLHIILRFELEQELLAGSVAVADLPEAWNARMKKYLGVDVPDDAHGVLQDMHWSAGMFGYFPTYQLGNVISVQIWERATADLGDVEEQFARGEFASVREWLSEHVYRHGGKYAPRDLLRRVTGSDLDPEPYLKYLRAKFA